MSERGLGDSEKAFFRITIEEQMRTPQLGGIENDHFRSTYQPGKTRVELTMPVPGMETKETNLYTAVVSTPSELPDGYILVTEKALELGAEFFYREINNVYVSNNGLVPERLMVDPDVDLRKGYNDVMGVVTSLSPADEVKGDK